MNEEKAIYYQKFPTIQYGNVVMGGERPLQPGETLMQVWADYHGKVNQAFKELFPPPAPPMATDFNTGEQVPVNTAKQERISRKAKDDQEFDDFKKQIDTFKSLEDATKFLSLSPFKHAIEAKKYVTEKFKTNGKK